MRESGLPKVLTWRWAPCVALALGALSFAGFAMLSIPEHIGDLGAAGPAGIGLPTGSGFGSVANGFQAQPASAPPVNWNDGSRAVSSPATQLAARAADGFPRRGFSPPLERAEPPAPPSPPSPPPVMPSPQPAAEAQLAPAAPAAGLQLQVAPPPTPTLPAEPAAAMATPADAQPSDAAPAR